MEKPTDLPPQSDNAVFTFGRFNPIHSGHKKLIDAVAAHARENGADPHIFASQTQDSKKNPLTFPQKIDLMRKMFPRANIHDEKQLKTVIDVVNHMSGMGYKKLTMLTGADRQNEFNNLLNKYKPEGTQIDVQSVGERDPESGEVDGMSGTKMRDHAVKKNFTDFKRGVPDQKHAREMYHAVRKGMRLENYQRHFKALFLVGGPGSGKDFIISSLLGEANLIELPLDKIIGAVNNGENLPEFDGFPSLIVNGNADVYGKVTVAKNILESMGYDTSMIYVYTSNEESKLRNDERIARQAKTFSEEVRYEKYNNSVGNLHPFSESFDQNFYIFDNSFDLATVGPTKKVEVLGWLNELGTYVSQFFETIATKEHSRMWLMENAEPPSATNNVYQMRPNYGKKRKSPMKKGKTDPAMNSYDKNIGAIPGMTGMGMYSEEIKKKILKKKEDKKQANPPSDNYRSEMGMVPSSGQGLVSTMAEGNEKSFEQLRRNLSSVLHNVDKE